MCGKPEIFFGYKRQSIVPSDRLRFHKLGETMEPIAWLPMQMHHGENPNLIGTINVENSERELSREMAADGRVDHAKVPGVRQASAIRRSMTE